MIDSRLASGKHGGIAGVCKVLALALPAAVLWHFLMVPMEAVLQAAGMGHMQAALQSTGGKSLRWGAACLGLMPVACMSYSLWQASQCFARFGRAEYFTLDVVRNLRRMSLGLLAAALASVLARPMASLLLSVGMPPGQRSLVLGIGSQEISVLLVCALLWQITSVMERAVALSEENKQFI